MAESGVCTDIVLGTYNGEKYLSEQIDSILAQEHTNWRLLVRDDGSTDGTVEILNSYATRHPDKIIPVIDDHGNLGVVENFSRLLERSDAYYTAFCDQDDVWLPDKLKRSIEAMKELEAAHGRNAPLLVFTDLAVVDQNLGMIGNSFWAYHGIDPSTFSNFARICLMNVVTGCTALLNRPLRTLATPIPPGAKVHDWWVALCASAFGHAKVLAEPTVLYRNHDANSIGASRPLERVLMVATKTRIVRQQLGQSFQQVEAFRKRFDGELSDKHSNELVRMLGIPGRNIFSKYCKLAGLGLKAHPIYLAGFALLIPGNTGQGGKEKF